MKTEPNDSINPCEVTFDENGNTKEFQQSISSIITRGLTKREYFAAMVLQGLCANSHVYDRCTDEKLSEVAVINADALINALNETK